MPLTAADRALAASFAGSLERKPAERSVDELTDADLHPFSAEVLYNGSPESEARLAEIDRGMDAWRHKE